MKTSMKKRGAVCTLGTAFACAALALCALLCVAVAPPAGATQQQAGSSGDVPAQQTAAGDGAQAAPAASDAFLTVYEQYGANGKLVERKAYTVDEFEALASTDRDPVSGMYYKSDGLWWATSSDYYVTLAELVGDAGIGDLWQDKATLLYGATGTSGLASVSFETLKKQCYFFPEATGSVLGGTLNPVTVEPVLSVTEYSDPLSTTMADLEESNLANANYKYEPQIIWGITKNGYKTGGYSTDPVDSVSGARYQRNINAIVVRNDIEITGGVEDNYTYAGEAIEPEPVVTYGPKTLVEGEDYTVSYEGNDTAGTASVSVTPIGEYAGAQPAKVTKKFEIAYGDFTKAKIAAIPDQVYTGSKIVPSLNVSYEGKTLRKNVDYVVVCENNVNVGTAKATVAGWNNFEGTQVVNFNIVAKDTNPDPVPKTSVWKRLFGNTAIGTMKAIVNEGWDKSDYAIVATTSGYYDALSASGLAGLLDCPILMTVPDKLTDATAKLITAKKVKNVIVVGGTSAVSDNAFNQIKKLGVSVERVAGNTAIGTANKIYAYGNVLLKAGKIQSGWGTDAIVATSSGFQDALSIAPYAYAKKAPIFLAKGKPGTLTGIAAKAIKAGKFTRTIITGGEAAVAKSVEGQVTGAKRLGGNTAYGTSRKIADFCLSKGVGMTATHLGVATGRSYYDALAGAALCGKKNSVLILADDGNNKNVDNVVKPHKADLQENCYIFGGEKAVSAAVCKAVEAASK